VTEGADEVAKLERMLESESSDVTDYIVELDK
jgi:hypothetical protein